MEIVEFESEMDRMLGQIWFASKRRTFEPCGKTSLYVYDSSDGGIAEMHAGIKRAKNRKQKESSVAPNIEFESETDRMFGQVWFMARRRAFSICGKKSLFVWTNEKGITSMRTGIRRAKKQTF